MTALTLRRLSDLRSCMERDPRTSALSNAEEALRQNPEVSAMFEATEKLREDYLRLRLENGNDDERTIAALSAFHQAKLKLDELPVAAEYSRCFSAVNSTLREIDAILFGEFRSNISCGRKHD